MSWSPPQQINLVDLSFMDTRFKLIEVAAFLDRVQRAGQDQDFRVQALKKALIHLSSSDTDRARKILESLSDPTAEAIPRATMQGALGAYQAPQPG